MALLQRITHPFVALLPDLNNVPQRRQAVGAIVASLVVHLLLLLFFVAMAGFIPDISVEFAKPKAELQPLELTIIDLSAPEEKPAELLSAEELKARAERPVIDSTGLAKSDAKPKDAIFESDQDMKAASEKPPTGDAPLPSQDGRALPFANFKDQDVVLGAAKMQPAPEPQEAAKPIAEGRPAPEPVATPMPTAKSTPPPAPEVLKPDDNQIAVATKMTEANEGPVTELTPPTPAFRARAMTPPKPERTELAKLTTPAPQAPGFQEQQIKTRVEGSISNRGAARVDALKTPMGVYMNQVKAAIASRWYFYMKQKRDLYSTGSAKVAFVITQEGKILDVRLLNNTSNSAFGMMCQQSVNEAEIAPPPEEAMPVMQDGKLEHDFTFNYVPIR
ncbi:MAG: TonB C-terminal domain-containing protein [Chthoniobacteraceae bacterium]